jgi:hypothetical protein
MGEEQVNVLLLGGGDGEGRTGGRRGDRGGSGGGLAVLAAAVAAGDRGAAGELLGDGGPLGALLLEQGKEEGILLVTPRLLARELGGEHVAPPLRHLVVLAAGDAEGWIQEKRIGRVG